MLYSFHWEVAKESLDESKVKYIFSVHSKVAKESLD